VIVVVIGPMGCGKTTVGKLVAARLGCHFDDADDFHPPENIAKMHAGIPLADEDRLGWLKTLKGRIEARRKAAEDLVLACSALKQCYRDLLGIDQQEVISVYLKGSFEQLKARIDGREHQYMNRDLLASQLATMEEPKSGLTVSIDRSPETLCDEIIAELDMLRGVTR
jgi:carbohydrate kinase (thermoresistant glucokinase family)